MSKFRPKERLRYGQYPVPAERADLYWGLDQVELAKITDGQLARLIIDSEDFQELIVPMLDTIDARSRNLRGNTMGRPSRFGSLHLESVLIYRRVAGLSTIKRTREKLFADLEAQRLLDLEGGLPSLKTMSRYMRERLDAGLRMEKYLELDRALRQRVLQLPGIDEECRVLGMDGSQHNTRFTPPIPNAMKQRRKERREGKTPRGIVNADLAPGTPGAITAPTAGFVGKEGGPKAGQGWQMIALWSEHGTLLAWDVSALNLSEKPAAERVLADYQREVLPHRGQQTLSVLTADGGFNSTKIRELAQEARIIPNIHKASHKIDFSQPGEKTANAETRNKEWLPFSHPAKPHYRNWLANGHAELRCSCGNGKTKRADQIGKTVLSIATKGNCPTCGNVTITAGQWRRAENGEEWVRCARGDRADLALGNSLTYNDKISREYGKDRYGWNESIHATLERRFGILKSKSWMRDLTEVKTEFAIATSAISILLLERAARKQAAQTVVALPSKPSRSGEALPIAA